MVLFLMTTVPGILVSSSKHSVEIKHVTGLCLHVDNLLKSGCLTEELFSSHKVVFFCQNIFWVVFQLTLSLWFSKFTKVTTG